MRALLHLLTLLPSDPLSKKIKTYLVEKMGLTPNIDNLEKILAYILFQEADDIAHRSIQEKASKSLLKVTEEELVKDPAKKEYNCRVCEKKHAHFAGS